VERGGKFEARRCLESDHRSSRISGFRYSELKKPTALKTYAFAYKPRIKTRYLSHSWTAAQPWSCVVTLQKSV